VIVTRVHQAAVQLLLTTAEAHVPEPQADLFHYPLARQKWAEQVDQSLGDGPFQLSFLSHHLRTLADWSMNHRNPGHHRSLVHFPSVLIYQILASYFLLHLGSISVKGRTNSLCCQSRVAYHNLICRDTPDRSPDLGPAVYCYPDCLFRHLCNFEIV
jgi:hypothetical protein